MVVVTHEDQQTNSGNRGHAPVLLEETIEHLAVKPGGRYIDATFGGGGHSRAMLDASGPDGAVLAIDADPDAIHRAVDLVTQFDDRFQIVQGNFESIDTIAGEREFEQVDGILFDLGLSSFQFDEHERGFSLHAETTLDMRLDPSVSGPTARDIVNEWSQEEIADVIFRFGEERRSRRIARAIVNRRSEEPIETNAELASIVERAVGGRRGARIHPATKTFQALRIAVNRELEVLETALAKAVDLLKSGGRLAVISFHSLEDRIVKQYFQRESRDCICPADLPVCVCDHKSTLRIVTRRTVSPGEDEIHANPRSRSARLRVAERI